MNQLFDLCVLALEVVASFTGLSYKEINIWIFVIIEPIVFLCMLIYIFRLRKAVQNISANR